MVESEVEAFLDGAGNLYVTGNGAAIKAAWDALPGLPVGKKLLRIRIIVPAGEELATVSRGPPAGYSKLPDGVRCRCVRLWADGESHYCCNLTRDLAAEPQARAALSQPNEEGEGK